MGASARFDPVAGFFLRALFALLPVLALWYALRGVALQPLAAVSEWLMHRSFPFWVWGTELNDVTQVLLTGLRVRDEQGHIGELTPEVNLLSYSYGVPLFIALLVALRSRGLWWKIPAGALALLPFQAFGVCMAWLVQVAVLSGEQTRTQTRLDVVDVNLIGAGYQLGLLILPMLAPVLLWLAFEHKRMRAAGLEPAA